MSTKIELQEPYRSDWRFGYLVTNKEPRRNVILYNSDTERSTVSYARYLYEVSIGEYISKDLVVDHIDGDQLNDTLDNYQLLTVGQNNIKRFKQTNSEAQWVDFECGTCGKLFSKPRNNTHLVVKSKKSDYCSRKCAGKLLSKSSVLLVYRANKGNYHR